MASVQEVEAQARGVLVANEDVVWITRVHGGWLLLTNRRLLMWKASARGHPKRVVLDEPLQRIEAEPRWSWSKLDRVLVVRRADGAAWRVAQGWGQRRAGGNDRATWLRRTARDIRAWTLLADITATQSAGGQAFDVAFARVHARALASLTPAQFARELGLEPSRVRDLLDGWGTHLSEGAMSKYTYTRRDRVQFNDDVKERLFVALVDQIGGDGLVQSANRATGKWWDTSAGALVENVLAAMDVETEHLSERRAPLALWESRMMWIGVIGAVIGTPLVFPPLLWLSSRRRWREGTTDRPDAAVYLGVVTAGALLALLLVGLAVNVGRLLTG